MHITLSPERTAAIDEVVAQAVAEGFSRALMSQDSTLWGPQAEPEAAIRLGWTRSPSVWLPLVEELRVLRESTLQAGLTRVVLCGMGGSSLAPEVMAGASGVEMTIVDTTHPDQLAPILEGDLSHTIVVVSSKSGGTVETDSQRRAFEQALRDQGIDPSDRIIVVTDPQSPLHQDAQRLGYRVFLSDPTIGGRFSALSPFGLVPSALAGVDIEAIVRDATSAHQALSKDAVDNPGLMLGAAISVSHPLRNKLLLHPFAALPGLGDWIEQLIAESTGKEGKGVLPVVGTHLEALPDGITVGETDSGCDISLRCSLGEHFLLWEFATALSGVVLAVNPFDQPNVESTKIAARVLVESPDRVVREELAVAGATVWASPPLPQNSATLSGVLEHALAGVGERSYVALCVFGNQSAQSEWERARGALESTLGRPVTLGFGPRFLHSTGQFHKGGPAEGVFVQILETPESTREIPGREFDFGTLLSAQAHADADVLAQSGVPVTSITVSRSGRAELVELLGG